jgi:ATP-dependent helicase Lhr and Lhr-like helicase
LRAARTDAPAGSDEHTGGRSHALVIAAADPAQPYGAVLPWPQREEREQRRRPARVAGAHVVLVDDEPVLYVERGGRGLVTLVDGPRAGVGGSGAGAAGARVGGESAPIVEALAALADAVRAGRVGKLALERIDGEPAIASQLVDALVELGFHPGPRKLTLSA